MVGRTFVVLVQDVNTLWLLILKLFSSIIILSVVGAIGSYAQNYKGNHLGNSS